MKRYLFALCCSLFVTACSAPAQSMTVDDFLTKRSALRAQGAAAAGSKDAALLQREMETIKRAYRGDIVAARRAGKTPHSCPPSNGKALTEDQFFAELERIPAAQRKMSMKDAFYSIMLRRFPCRR